MPQGLPCFPNGLAGMSKAALLEDARQCILKRPALQKRFLSGTLSRADVQHLATAMNATVPGSVTRHSRSIRNIPNTTPVSEVAQVLNDIVGCSLEENDIIQLWESVEAIAKAAEDKDLPSQINRILTCMSCMWSVSK